MFSAAEVQEYTNGMNDAVFPVRSITTKGKLILMLFDFHYIDEKRDRFGTIVEKMWDNRC